MKWLKDINCFFSSTVDKSLTAHMISNFQIFLGQNDLLEVKNVEIILYSLIEKKSVLPKTARSAQTVENSRSMFPILGTIFFFMHLLL